MEMTEIVKGASVVAGVVLSLTIHEWAHALVADRRGDPTPRELGRLTLNPIKHIHPVLTVLLPAFLWFVLPALTGGRGCSLGEPSPSQSFRRTCGTGTATWPSWPQRGRFPTW